MPHDLALMKQMLDDGQSFEDAIDMYIDLKDATWREAYACYRTVTDPPHPYGEVRAYDETKDNMVFNLRLLGATNIQIAEALSISLSKLNRWREQYPDFKQAYDAGGVEANAFVAQSLYKRARGYTVKEAKIATHEGQVTDVVYVDKEIAPDFNAIKWWLKTKVPGYWTDEQRLQVNANVTSEMTDEQLAQALHQAGLQAVENPLNNLQREPINEEPTDGDSQE